MTCPTLSPGVLSGLRAETASDRLLFQQRAYVGIRFEHGLKLQHENSKSCQMCSGFSWSHGPINANFPEDHRR